MEWKAVLIEPVKSMLVQVGQFLSSLVFVILILIVGWIIAKIVKELVTRFLKLIKLDELADKINANEVLTKGGVTYSVAELLGLIAYWVVILMTFVCAVNAIGLTVAADLLNKIILYVPNIVAAIFILLLGFFAATLLSGLIQTVAANAGISQAKMLAKIVEVVTIIFAVIIGLEQLQIAGILMIERVVLILLASLGLAIALAFGLGCKDVAGKMVHDLLEKVKSKK